MIFQGMRALYHFQNFKTYLNLNNVQLKTNEQITAKTGKCFMTCLFLKCSILQIQVQDCGKY